MASGRGSGIYSARTSGERMTLTVERWYPFAWAWVTGLGAGLVTSEPPKASLINSLTGHGINVAAIAVGFLATSLSILVSIERARVIQVLRDADYYPIVLAYLVAPIRLWFTVALSSAVLLIVWEHLSPAGPRLAFAPWIALVAWAPTATYRVAAVLARIVKRPAQIN